MTLLFFVGDAADGSPPPLGGAALGFLAGAAIGAGLALVHTLARRAGERRGAVLWKVAGALFGLSAADGVGAFDKLFSAHAGLAWATLVAGLVGGAAFGASVGFSQRVDEALSLRRAIAAALGLAFSLALVLAEPTLLVLRGYPSARAAMLAAAWIGAAASCNALVAHYWLERPNAALGAVLGLAAASSIRVATLDRADVSRLLTASEPRRAVLVLRALTDFDQDGASSFLYGGDCAPFDRAVGPNATEIPGNGVDDNCAYGDAPRRASIPISAYPRVPSEPSPLNVVLVTIDALRPDRTTAYGYARRTTPNLARLAAAGTRFDRAYTSGGWTAIALPSMLYGLYPRAMSWHRVALTKKGATIVFPWANRIPDGDAFEISRVVPAGAPRPDLPFWLRRRGMRTAAIVANKLVGFQEFLDSSFDSFRRAPADDDGSVAELAVEEIRSNGARPLFLWVHFFEPHEPMGKAPGAPNFGAGFEDLYDRDVAYCDAKLGALLAAIDAPGARPTAVIVASDHGEIFDRGLQFHGVDVSNPSTRIVLVARGPGLSPGAIVDSPTSLVDIFPTVLGWTATPEPAEVDGSDLRSPPADRAVITDLFRHDPSGARFLDQIAVSSARGRLTLDATTGLRTLLTADDGRDGAPAEDSADARVLENALGAYLERAEHVP